MRAPPWAVGAVLWTALIALAGCGEGYEPAPTPPPSSPPGDEVDGGVEEDMEVPPDAGTPEDSSAPADECLEELEGEECSMGCTLSLDEGQDCQWSCLWRDGSPEFNNWSQRLMLNRCHMEPLPAD